MRGWKPDLCLVNPDDTAGPALERQLAAASYDCVVIGGGLRIPPESLLLFEVLVNAVHRAAPDVPIAFNTQPRDTWRCSGALVERLSQRSSETHDCNRDADRHRASTP